MIEVNRQGEVWVFAEQHLGKVEDIAFELLGRARELADKLGVKVGAVIAGDSIKSVCEELIQYGADKVYAVENNLLEHYQTNSYTKVLCTLIEKHKPQIVLYGASPVGRDLAPRVASKMKAGLTADCTDLQIGNHEIKKTGEKHENLLLQIRPAFGGNIIATIINYDRWPQMATVREGVMPMPEPDAKRKGEVIDESVSLSAQDLPIEIIEQVRREKSVNLKASRIIVAGGAGVGSKENFRMIWDLANALGGVPAATRAAADLGYIGKDYQVGQTGTTVRPSLYIAIGLSGAIQHQAGMSESKKIIAVNNDPDAAIFDVAHYKVCGDLNEVVPQMIKAVKEKV
ncbi:electron transfer flavoprotein subunit alpha/FixB family protein [Sedimentisphaera salicampi]|uniref:Electron transfer flavoprotein large subunit n=1 Tax=Sedimentisphaera salicampi TaxID=1941349 RepID=A0A1W6LNN5_9BACT|nr:electron transfer flavoprotein subunit alpha/FixB family protein [Sedimentisphaera salicampi]ARN57374.1 Electron transfer flavoprotein large subunit [Sedimentisphaera salicampi]OXU14579.1 Electron transfer flavoprotein large subunit [Sedimentisphaera salicampi]